MSGSHKDIDDVDDDVFISKKPQNYIFADKKAADIQERSNKMLLNSRILVQESEAIGQNTLEMLSSQRETLERAENNLDHINTMTRYTQKQLKNMRSFFGGIKSIFGSSDNSTASIPPPVPVPGPGPSSSSAGGNLPRSATVSNMPSGPWASTSAQTANRRAKDDSGPAGLGPGADKITDSPFYDDLDELGSGLGRLKDMAMRLGDEIGDQNDMLDRITDKSERAGDSIKHQNREMAKILKKS